MMSRREAVISWGVVAVLSIVFSGYSAEVGHVTASVVSGLCSVMSLAFAFAVGFPLKAQALHPVCPRCDEMSHPDYFPYCSEACEQGEGHD